MELKIKRLDEKAVLPIRAHKGDAGLDLTATDITLEPNDCGQTVVVYHCGLAVEIPEGHVGLVFPRSSISKKSMFLTNAVGVIDSGYRGEITAKMHITEVAELSETERGEGGYGSSDEKLSAPDAAAEKTQDVESTTTDATMVAADSVSGSEIAE